MEAIPRNTPALLGKIDQIRNSLIKRFENVIALAAINETDRNSTALTTYQLRIETAGLIRTSEDILTLTRQMQDLWLFGQLHTLETQTKVEHSEQSIKAVASLIERLAHYDGGDEQMVHEAMANSDQQMTDQISS